MAHNLNPHGYAIWTPREGGKAIESDTICCCHCGEHVLTGGLKFPWTPKRRCGYCMNCGARTCGKPSCDPCVSRWQKLLNAEAGKDLLHKPIIVPVGFGD